MNRMPFLLLPLFLAANLFSQTTPETKTMTLEQSLSIALERNVDVARAYHNIDNARAGVVSAYGSYVPKLSAGVSYARTGYSTPPSIRTIGGIPFNVPKTETYYDTYNGAVGLSYTVFDGFSRESNFSSAQSIEIQAEQSYDRTRQSIANSVINSYLSVLRNGQQVKVFQENLNDERNRLQRIMEQKRVGAVAVGDVYRQQSTFALSEYNLISAQNSYDKSKADLLNLLALDVSADYAIVDPTIDSKIKQVESDSIDQPMGSFADLRRRALESRLDYASVRENVTLADIGITQAWSNYYPSLNLNGGYSTNAQSWGTATSSDNKSFNVGLSLSWQLPEIFGALQRVQTAKISRKIAVLQSEQKARDITVELKKALLDLDAARKQYQASQRSRVAAEEDKKVAEEKYNLGSGTLLDVQVATTAYLNAQVTTLYNAYNYFSLKKNVELVVGERKY